MISIRKIRVIGRTYRNLNRYRQILAVLFKYGFNDIVELLRIDQYIEIGLQVISRKRGERVERLSRAVRVGLAIEELGPNFSKPRYGLYLQGLSGDHHPACTDHRVHR